MRKGRDDHLLKILSGSCTSKIKTTCSNRKRKQKTKQLKKGDPEKEVALSLFTTPFVSYVMTSALGSYGLQLHLQPSSVFFKP